MNLISHHDRPVLGTALDEIIHTHGLWPVMKAVLMRSIRRKPPPFAERDLSDHLRRDIGLAPLGGPGRSSMARW